MMALVTGGSKCGKSSFAESLFDNYNGAKFYVATMLPNDPESLKQIEIHRKNRMGKGFETIEKFTDIDEINVRRCGILLECLGNLLANEIFSGNKINDPVDKIMRGIDKLKSNSDLFVIVSNDVARDGILYDDTTEKYIRYLVDLNSKIAKLSDIFVECVYGIPIIGGKNFENSELAGFGIFDVFANPDAKG